MGIIFVGEIILDRMTVIFSYRLYDYGGFHAKIQANLICFDLVPVVETYLDVSDVFPKDKYGH